MKRHLTRAHTGFRPAARLAVLLAACLAAGAPAQDEPPVRKPRDHYNEGTQKLRQGKLREAEASFQAALASQQETIQAPSLYNLGHARFAQGVQELKNGPAPKNTSAQAKRATDAADDAINFANTALGMSDEQALLAAYMRGRGVRKELKAASQAVKAALESYGAVLNKWQRASGDFKSADELNPSDADARFNADIVDRCIARLIDSQQMMMNGQQGMKQKQQQLAQKMKELKQRMSPQMRQQCPNGEEEDEEEDGKKPPPEPKPGQEQPKPKDGQKTPLTPEEAARLLEMLKLDANRKLPLGVKDSGETKDRNRKNW